MGNVLSFPDRSAILIDRNAAGEFTVEPWLCPLAAGRGRAFTHAGDAIDYAESLAHEFGTAYILMCDA